MVDSARRRGWFSFLHVAALAAVAICAGSQTPPTERVALLIESRALIYQQAAQGVERALDGSAQVERFYLDGDARDAGLQAVSRWQPDLIVAIGTQAARSAQGRLSDDSILYCLALPKNNLTGENIAGVRLDIETARQVEVMLKALPHVRRIGVVYDNLASGDLIGEARKYLPPDVELIGRVAGTRKEAATQTRYLLENELAGDAAFWLLWDPVMANPANFDLLIKLSRQYGVPVVAPARPFVEAGALISIGPNYDSAGEQAGRLARQVLSGERQLADIQSTWPEEIAITVNGEVARRLGIEFPRDLPREILSPPQTAANRVTP